jgi:hypothetical protein
MSWRHYKGIYRQFNPDNKGVEWRLWWHEGVLQKDYGKRTSSLLALRPGCMEFDIERFKQQVRQELRTVSNDIAPARKSVIRYLHRKFSYILQEIFVILYTGMLYLFLLISNSKCIFEIKLLLVEQHTIWNLAMQKVLHLHRKFLFLDFVARKKNIFSRPDILWCMQALFIIY